MLADVFRVIGEENEPPFAVVVSYFVAAAPFSSFVMAFFVTNLTNSLLAWQLKGDASSVNVAASIISGTACKNCQFMVRRGAER